MAKRPTRPRYYKTRKAYYFQDGGKQILLAKGEQDDPEVKKKAWAKFQELIPDKTSKVIAITDDEIAKLDQNADTALVRVMRIMAGTGCRPGEACTMAAEHLDHEKRAVRIGNRMVTCEEGFFSWLARLAKDEPSDLLPSNYGRPWTVDSLCRWFSSLRDQREMRKELTLYSFRHSYAQNFLKNGGSVPDLATKLGISEKQVRKLYRPGTSDNPK